MSRLRNGVTVYQGARKFVGDVPDGVTVSPDYLADEPSVITAAAPTPTTTAEPEQE